MDRGSNKSNERGICIYGIIKDELTKGTVNFIEQKKEVLTRFLKGKYRCFHHRISFQKIGKNRQIKLRFVPIKFLLIP